MKEKIHPKYGECKVTCGCGNTFITGSVKKELHVDVCSKCHPFFTGKQRDMSARGRIEKFNKRYKKDEKGKLEMVNGGLVLEDVVFPLESLHVYLVKPK